MVENLVWRNTDSLAGEEKKSRRRIDRLNF